MMMAQVDIQKQGLLAARLIKKTLNRELWWREGSSEDEYFVDFQNTAVSLFRVHDDHRVYSVALSIYNGSGEPVDSFFVSDVLGEVRGHLLKIMPSKDYTSYELAEYFFDLVRSQVLQVDDVYDEVLQELAG